MSNKRMIRKKTAPAHRDWAKMSFAQKKPQWTALMMVILYFMLDAGMMDTEKELGRWDIASYAIMALVILYIFYAGDYHRNICPTGGTDVPKFIKHRKQYVLIGFAVFFIWGILFLAAGPVVIPKLFPTLAGKFSQAQLALMLLIAPVMEEVTFRYLLYDRWLRQKYGWLLGFIVASFLFVMCHPITNLHSFIVYWAPTVMFFLVYHDFGLYGAILMHMIYNMIAI